MAKKTPLWFPFLLAIFASLVTGALFPWIRLSLFAPYLCLVYNRCSFAKSLWLSFIGGVFLDLLCGSQKLGLYGLSHILATLCLFPHRRHFFEDKALSLSLFSALAGFILTYTQYVLFSFLETPISLSFSLLFQDLLTLPLLDGTYAFLWFTCPLKVYAHIQRVGLKNLWKPPEEEHES